MNIVQFIDIDKNDELNRGRDQMNWNMWIRQTHRWLSIVFTLTVVAHFPAMGLVGEPPMWVVYSPLPPLFLMLITGLCMFVLPYATRGR